MKGICFWKVDEVYISCFKFYDKIILCFIGCECFLENWYELYQLWLKERVNFFYIYYIRYDVVLMILILLFRMCWFWIKKKFLKSVMVNLLQ